VEFQHSERFLEAHRVLGEQGHDELHFGHLSAVDREAGVMWIKRGDSGFRNMKTSWLQAVDFEGNCVAGEGPVHTEIWLHLAIYGRRPDVNAIAHSHARPLIAYSAVEPNWPIIDQYTCEMSHGLCYYDHSGLIVTPELGDALADSLGTDGRTCILRSHGILVADRSIEAAVVGTVEFGRSVDIQLMARALGTVRPMKSEDVGEMLPRFISRRDNRVRNMWRTLTLDHRL
jgi:ribulose-5-phosphate 4-epimerase/fuculose-1-phosphate aldolase